MLSFGANAQYSAQITEAEFFWGATDPGAGNGIAISAQDGSYNDAIESAFQSNIAPPNSGINLLNVRMKGTDGVWSPLFKSVVYVDQPFSSDMKITQGEYFIDTDNGEGNNQALLAIDGNFDSAIEGALRNGISTPSTGIHTLGVRMKGLDGTWGPIFKIIFSVDEQNQFYLNLTSAEFFFDTDPGQGAATQMVAGDGNFNGCIEAALASPSSAGLTEGLHKLSVRMKGTDGVWGPVFSVIVVVNPCSPNPVATVTSGGSTTICPGDNVVLTANSGAGLTYQWLKDGSIISGATSQSFNADAAGYYAVAVTNSGGCTTVSDSIVITVGGTPPSVSIVSDSGTAICTNDEVTFTATPLNGGATPAYQWQVNGINVGTNSATYTTTSLTNNAVVRCILTSSEVCVFPETDTSNLITMTVKALPSGSITLNGTTSLCTGESVTLTAQAGNTYFWNTGAISQLITVNSAGSYFVTITGPNGCSVKSDTIQVTINDIDNTVSLSGVTLTAHQTGASYQWLDCNNGNLPIPGETSQSFEPTENGNYAVEVTANGCSETSVCVVVNSVGIESLGQNGWNVYPNPNSGVFTVTSIQEFNNAVIEIYSAVGQLIYKNIHSGNSIVIELAEQPTGVYILKVNNQQNFRVIKL